MCGLFVPPRVTAQQKYIPPELQAVDPEVREALTAARTRLEAGDLVGAESEVKSAIEIAAAKGLESDKALAEENKALLFFAKGKLSECKLMFSEALQHATSSPALQADILTALASFEDIKGEPIEATSLLKRALERARASKSRYLQSRVLGELARIQVNLRDLPAARQNVEEALRIDVQNNFDWKPSHTLVLAWLVAAEQPDHIDRAIEIAEDARSAASKAENYLVFLQACSGVAQGYLRQGNSGRALQIIAELRTGRRSDGQDIFRNRNGYENVLKVPIYKLLVLDSAALVDEAAGRSDDAVSDWAELYRTAADSGATALIGESAAALARHALGQKNYKEASHYAKAATDAWRTVGNEQQLLASSLVLHQSLIASSANADVKPVLDEVIALAERSRDDILVCSAEIELGKFNFRNNDYDAAIIHLARAETVARSVTKADDAFIANYLGLEISLAGAYQKQNRSIDELISLERALPLAAAIKRWKDFDWLRPLVAQKVNTLFATVDQLLADGHHVDAFAVLVLTYKYREYEAIISGQDVNQDTQAKEIRNRIISLLDEIDRQPKRIAQIEPVFGRLGSDIGTVAQAPASFLLARYWLLSGGKPERAKDYAKVVIASFAPQNLLAVEASCWLSVGDAQTGQLFEAKKQADECLKRANELGTVEGQNIANAAFAWVHVLANEPAAAKKSLEFLLKSKPDDPLLYIQLAGAYERLADYSNMLRLLESALDLYKKKNDVKTAADLDLRISALVDIQAPNHTPSAEAYLTDASTLYTARNDPNGQIRCFQAFAEHYSRLKRFEEQRRYLELAVDMSRRMKLPNALATSLADLGRFYFFQNGNNDKAIPVLRESANQFSTLDNPAAEALNLRILALALHQQGAEREALDAAERAVKSAERSNNWAARYWALRTLASLITNDGEYGRALTHLLQAKAIAAQAQQALNVGWAQLDMIGILEITGDWDSTLQETKQAVELFGKLGRTDEAQVGLFSAYSLLVGVYAARESPLKNLPKALEAFDAAKQLNPTGSNKIWLDVSVLEAYWQLGRYDDAIQICRSALQFFRTHSNKLGEAVVLLEMANVERRAGRLREAQRHIAEAEPLVSHTHNLYTLGSLYYGKAAQAKADGALEESVRWYEKVISLIEDVKATNTEAPNKIAENYTFIYEELLDVLYRLHQKSASEQRFSSEAFSIAESNKARLFIKSWGRTFANAARRQLPPSVQEDERGLFLRLVDAENLLRARMSANPSTVADADAQLQRARQDYSKFIDRLRATYPRYAGLLQPSATTVATLPLHPGELLIEFKCLDDGVLVWGISGSEKGNELRLFYKAEVARQWLREKVTHIRDGLNSSHPRDFGADEAEALFERLISPALMAEIFRASSVTVVPDDVLYLLPLEILSPEASKGEFVLNGKAFRYLPAASALQMVRNGAGNREWQKQFLGIADPITSHADVRYDIAYDNRSSMQLDETQFTKERARGLVLSRIPATADEVHAIAELFGANVELRIGLEANKPNIVAMELSRFRFLHFATHGLLPVESGISEPALVLSYDGKSPEDMLLTMSEILGLSVSADMVVLSACNTGTGEVSRAEGTFNLGRAFLVIGAENVTVSLWHVDDESTAKLMKIYYSGMIAGKTKAEALAAARKAITDDSRFRSPYYWAAFVLIGD
jgi:CHAT domain-containing protein